MRHSASMWRLALAILSILSLTATASAQNCTPGNLLKGLPITSAAPLAGIEKINDGAVTGDGQNWDSPAAVAFTSENVPIVITLSAPQHIRSLAFQADNNDEYRIDGQTEAGDWIRIWVAPTSDIQGLQTRRITFGAPTPPLKALSIRTNGGDEKYSISEVYAGCGTTLPEPEKIYFQTPDTHFLWSETVWLIGLIAAIAISGLKPFRGALFQVVIAAYIAVHSVCLLLALFSAGPLSSNLLVTQRTVIALAGIFSVGAFLTFSRSAKLQIVVISALAVLAVCNYLQFGKPQFTSASGETVWSHTVDLRNYYPASKYFRETGYEGVYIASLAAYEDITGTPIPSIPDVAFRDLTTLEVQWANRFSLRALEMRGHFTPARWESFRNDMRYFLTQLGPDGYIRSLVDHGANAAPPWIFIANLLFRFTSPSELLFTLTGLIDILLLAASAVVIARTFGLKTALLVAILFGTSDLPYFSASWLGATLRYDWFAATAFGVCALKARRFSAGGIWLTTAAMLRVFPGFALFGALLPLAYRAYRRRRIRSSSGAMPLARVVRGALITAVVLGVLPIIAFGYSASWGNWFSRIARHDAKPNANAISWRMIVSYDPAMASPSVMMPENPEPWIRWQEIQSETLQSRELLFRGGQLLALLSILVLAYRARPHEGALLGLFLVPIFSNPSQYYLHYIALTPLLFARRTHTSDSSQLIAFALLLGFAVLQNFARLIPDSDVCYAVESAALLFVLATVVTAFLRFQLPRLQTRTA